MASDRVTRILEVLDWLRSLRFGASLQQIKDGVDPCNEWSRRTIQRDLVALYEAGKIDKAPNNRWKARTRAGVKVEEEETRKKDVGA